MRCTPGKLDTNFYKVDKRQAQKFIGNLVSIYKCV